MPRTITSASHESPARIHTITVPVCFWFNSTPPGHSSSPAPPPCSHQRQGGTAVQLQGTSPAGPTHVRGTAGCVASELPGESGCGRAVRCNWCTWLTLIVMHRACRKRWVLQAGWTQGSMVQYNAGPAYCRGTHYTEHVACVPHRQAWCDCRMMSVWPCK